MQVALWQVWRQEHLGHPLAEIGEHIRPRHWTGALPTTPDAAALQSLESFSLQHQPSGAVDEAPRLSREEALDMLFQGGRPFVGDDRRSDDAKRTSTMRLGADASPHEGIC